MDHGNHRTKNIKHFLGFSIKHFLGFLIHETADLVTFTEEIFNGKLHFLCNEDQKLLVCDTKT